MNRNPARQVAIIGGGIAGLATAYTIQEKARAERLPVRFTLFESASYLGGKILSEHIDEFTVEGGPDSFLQQKVWAAQLAQSLGLEPDLIGANPHQQKLFVVNRGRLTPMPDGVMMVIPTRFMPFITSSLISWPGKVRMGMDFFIPRRQDDSDESIGDFIHRRLGQEALDKLAEPLMSGIHVSDPMQQSLLGTFPRFRTLEKQYGSLTRGMLAQRRSSHSNGKNNGAATTSDRSWKDSVFVSLRGGMGQLVHALEKALRDGQIHTNCVVSQLTPLAEGGYQIASLDSETSLFDAVVLAAPAFVSAGLVSPFSPALAHALAGIRYVSTATVSLAYPKSKLDHPVNGIGFIVPRSESRRITACTMSSTKFSDRAPEDCLLLRSFVGGPWNEQAVEPQHSDDEIIHDVQAEMAALLDIHVAPVMARVYRWIKGNAQYDVGHLDRVKGMHAMSAGTPGLFLTGSAYEGIGVPDCIHQGQQAAEKVITFLAAAPAG